MPVEVCVGMSPQKAWGTAGSSPGLTDLGTSWWRGLSRVPPEGSPRWAHWKVRSPASQAQPPQGEWGLPPRHCAHCPFSHTSLASSPVHSPQLPGHSVSPRSLPQPPPPTRPGPAPIPGRAVQTTPAPWWAPLHTLSIRQPGCAASCGQAGGHAESVTDCPGSQASSRLSSPTPHATGVPAARCPTVSPGHCYTLAWGRVRPGTPGLRGRTSWGAREGCLGCTGGPPGAQ